MHQLGMEGLLPPGRPAHVRATHSTIDIAKAFVVTDADGDFVALDNGATIAIENDVPVNNTNTLTAQTVYEDGLTLANSNNQSVGNQLHGCTCA